MRNAKMTIVAVLVALVAITTYSVSGTYAKYTDTFESSTDSAKVAKWAIDLQDKDGTSLKTQNNEFTFNLFDTILDTVDGNKDDDVEDGLIAPGTKGEMQLNLVNNSEVTAEYTVEFKVENDSNVPLVFTVNGTEVTLDGHKTDKQTININGSDTVTIGWYWTFEVDDATNKSDTELGASTDDIEVTVSAKVIVDQKD